MQVSRATKLTDDEERVVVKCALCGKHAAGRRDLVFYIYIKSFDTKWRHKVVSKKNVEACAPGGGAS